MGVTFKDFKFEGPEHANKKWTDLKCWCKLGHYTAWEAQLSCTVVLEDVPNSNERGPTPQIMPLWVRCVTITRTDYFAPTEDELCDQGVEIRLVMYNIPVGRGGRRTEASPRFQLNTSGEYSLVCTKAEDRGVGTSIIFPRPRICALKSVGRYMIDVVRAPRAGRGTDADIRGAGNKGPGNYHRSEGHTGSADGDTYASLLHADGSTIRTGAPPHSRAELGTIVDAGSGLSGSYSYPVLHCTGAGAERQGTLTPGGSGNTVVVVPESDERRMVLPLEADPLEVIDVAGTGPITYDHTGAGELFVFGPHGALGALPLRRGPPIVINLDGAGRVTYEQEALKRDAPQVVDLDPWAPVIDSQPSAPENISGRCGGPDCAG
jgi:hypothetical protein